MNDLGKELKREIIDESDRMSYWPWAVNMIPNKEEAVKSWYQQQVVEYRKRLYDTYIEKLREEFTQYLKVNYSQESSQIEGTSFSVIKRIFHTFDFEHEKIKRKITLCIMVAQYTQESLPHIRVGYSICMPMDKFDKDMAKTISEGRAIKQPFDYQTKIDKIYSDNYSVLKGIAIYWQHKLQDNIHLIKGVKEIKKKKKRSRNGSK